MSLRDKLITYITETIEPDQLEFLKNPTELVNDVSDAILATIKASVPELVWVRNGNHWAGGHGYVIRKIGSQHTLTIRNQHGQQFDTLKAAKDAAQAHYVATLTDWMMK